MTLRANRSIRVALLMAVLVVLAGCSGGSGSDDSTTTMETTGMETVEETTAGSGSTSHGETTMANGTTMANETTMTVGTTTTNGTTVSSGENDSAASGPMLVVLDGRDTHVGNASASENASFWVDGSHTWHASNESVSLATALSHLGMEANQSSLTYDNTTYRDDANNTTVSYRVNGQPVEDVQNYEVEAGDKIFVTAHTGNVSTPGRYYNATHPHPHGTLNVTVNGNPVNFTKSKYTHADKYFHFHGDEGAERWHAHSMNLTVGYAISSFPGLNITNDTLTYENTTYTDGNGAKINVTVNGETVDPSTYVLKDGDEVRVAIEKNGSN